MDEASPSVCATHKASGLLTCGRLRGGRKEGLLSLVLTLMGTKGQCSSPRVSRLRGHDMHMLMLKGQCAGFQVLEREEQTRALFSQG